MNTPFYAIKVEAFLNDMGTKEILSFDRLPNAREHIALVRAAVVSDDKLIKAALQVIGCFDGNTMNSMPRLKRSVKKLRAALET